MRNRLFGFGYYEGYRNDSGITQNILVLSAAQRAGDFSGGAAIRDPLTGQPFAGNVIPAARISPVGRAAAQRLRAAAQRGRQSLHRVADGVTTHAISSASGSITSSAIVSRCSDVTCAARPIA